MIMENENNHFFSKKFIFGLSAAIFWAIAIVAARFIFQQGESPYTFVFWTTIAAIPAWSLYLIKHNKEFKILRGKLILSLLIIGVVGSIGINIMESLALKNTTAINFAFLVRAIVVFTVIFAYIFFKEPITTKKSLLILIILAGSFLLVTKGTAIKLQRGDLYTLIVAATIAFVNNILVKFTVSVIHPDLSAALVFFIGLAPITLFAYLNQGLKMPLSWPIIFLVVICNVLLVQFRNRAYKIATASFVTMMMSFTPVITAGLSLIILKETLSLIQIAGGALIVSAGILAQRMKI